ncbi:MAG: hypothetical protein IIT39_09945 [Clostridia bacterium]|nr:hypothetical protein [Clostridia bacterium]
MDNEAENKILRCEYEKLLFERDRVKKEADNYLRLYIHEPSFQVLEKNKRLVMRASKRKKIF